jgi:hypothetical protein
MVRRNWPKIWSICECNYAIQRQWVLCFSSKALQSCESVWFSKWSPGSTSVWSSSRFFCLIKCSNTPMAMRHSSYNFLKLWISFHKKPRTRSRIFKLITIWDNEILCRPKKNISPNSEFSCYLRFKICQVNVDSVFQKGHAVSWCTE